MFYYDNILKKYESNYLWDKSLLYLKKLYDDNPSAEVLNSLIGFSWYYLIEGLVESKTYNIASNVALEIWSTFLDVGFESYNDTPSFCFIAGYTILLHGFYIDKYKDSYEEFGLSIIKKILYSNDYLLKKIVNIILEYQAQKKYKPLKLNQELISKIFIGDSMLDKYFREIFS